MNVTRRLARAVVQSEGAMGMEEAGRYLASRRENRKLTQVNVADELGVSPQIISMWERGLSEPLSAHLMRLCDVIGADVGVYQALYLGKDMQKTGASTVEELRRFIEEELKSDDQSVAQAAADMLARMFRRPH